ncbi:unnamed protein product [Mucor hiemalis]
MVIGLEKKLFSFISFFFFLTTFLEILTTFLEIFTMTKARKRSLSIEKDASNFDVNDRINHSVDEIQSTLSSTTTEPLKENIKKRKPNQRGHQTKVKMAS